MTITKKELKTPHPETGRKVAYLVRVENGVDPETGKRRWMTKQVATSDEAKDLHKEWSAAVARGTALVPSRTTVSELLADWLRSKAGQISANSLHDYETACRLHIIPALGGTRVQQVTPAQLQRQYDDWREAGLSARMVRGCHMRLSQAFDRAERHGIVLRNPCRAVDPPRLERATVSTWTKEEARCFLDTTQHRPSLTVVAIPGAVNPMR